MSFPRSITRPPRQYNPSAIFWLSFVHIGALVSFAFFTWPAFWLCLILLFSLSPLGVTLTYHRLLSHRALRVPRWLEYTLAFIGVLSAQGSPLLWVAQHRKHHRFSDTDRDPHDARKGFFYSHIGHLLVSPLDTPEWHAAEIATVPDLSKQAYYRFLDRFHIPIVLTSLPILYWIGGFPFMFWGAFMRVTLMLHITWFVNSAAHTFGYRNFETADSSRNCWWVALLAAGEGWHNNHHAAPACAAHGLRWWELDMTWMIIRGLEKLGLATDVRRPTVRPTPMLRELRIPVSAHSAPVELAILPVGGTSEGYASSASFSDKTQ